MRVMLSATSIFGLWLLMMAVPLCARTVEKKYVEKIKELEARGSFSFKIH